MDVCFVLLLFIVNVITVIYCPIMLCLYRWCHFAPSNNGGFPSLAKIAFVFNFLVSYIYIPETISRHECHVFKISYLKTFCFKGVNFISHISKQFRTRSPAVMVQLEVILVGLLHQTLHKSQWKEWRGHTISSKDYNRCIFIKFIF